MADKKSRRGGAQSRDHGIGSGGSREAGFTDRNVCATIGSYVAVEGQGKRTGTSVLQG